MINKMIEIVPGETWVALTEMPTGSIRLEGLRKDLGSNSYQAAYIIFTKACS